MFIERLKKTFKSNEPIFANEIINLFSEFSRAYIFRLIDQALKNGDIVKFDTGIYFIPKKNILGNSSITIEDVLQKKYVGFNNQVFGVYSGLYLQNMFNFTTQVPNTIEVTSNNVSMRCRKIMMGGRNIILRKSRCNIDENNAAAYTILELLSDIDLQDEMSAVGMETITKYMKQNKINVGDLISLAKVFPAKTMKNLVYSGILEI